MKNTRLPFLIIVIALFSIASCSENEEVSKPKADSVLPYLNTKGDVTQLMVNDTPFIIRGGELGNSSFTSLEYMEPLWPKLEVLNLNTILAPVYWELIEPKRGEYDFTLFDELVEKTRAHNLKLVILWFGSWKNSMSSHVPAWIKTNQDTYPRIKSDKEVSEEILTPFSKNNLMADMDAFKALMRHIKAIDSEHRTIIMIQPENEIGMLPSARDYHPLANKQFEAGVPQKLIDYLVKNKDQLVPEFYEVWEKNGFKTSGNWEEVFGKGDTTDEIFMAWYYAVFTNEITQAGKEIYPLPMYVNAALNRPGRKPGSGYPSAGPLPHLMDVWQAAAPSVDFLSPDIYFPNLEHWADLYVRQNNPLFIPEASFDETAAAKALFSIGHYESLGFSPFSIESTPHPEKEELAQAYHLVKQLTPLITEHHGSSSVEGVLLDKENPERKLAFGDFEFTIKHSHTLGWEAQSSNETWLPAGAIIIQTTNNEFYLAGSGVVITFQNIKNPEMKVGILKAEEGRFENKDWQVIRHLNGDQTHQGRHIRQFRGEYAIQRFKLYNYH